MDLVEGVYRCTESSPRTELYGLTAQLHRAAVSIPSNIAEGQSRDHLNKYLHHLSFAQGSCAEIQTQLEIAVRLGFCGPEQIGDLTDMLAVIRRQLHALRNALQKADDHVT